VEGCSPPVDLGAACVGGSDPDRAKVNQDCFFAATLPLGASSQCLAAGVMDGHGKKGQLVSQALQNFLPRRLSEELGRLPSAAAAAPPAAGAVEEALVRAFCAADADLAAEVAVTDARRSGAACVVALVWQHGDSLKVSVANAGDCRAVLGLRRLQDTSSPSGGGAWAAEALLRPSTVRIPGERARVEAAGGRVDASGNVWAGPFGVAMTQALGDHVLRPYGVICEPEVATYSVTSDHQALLLLVSDGVSDLLSDSDVVRLVAESLASGASPPGAAQALVARSRERWQDGLPIEVRIDDATALLLPLPLHWPLL